MDENMSWANKNSSIIENDPPSAGLLFGQNSSLIENDLAFVPSSSGFQFGQSSSMFESQLNSLAIESKSISENEIMQLLTDGESNCNDNQDDNNDEHPNKKMRNHRHTKQQIEAMEALYKECPLPDQKKREELSCKLGLESSQVKFWFQNKRTKIKNQDNHDENSSLRAENEKLKAECLWLSEAINNGCPKCGNHSFHLGETSNNEQYLRLENARLQQEVVRVSRSYIIKVAMAAMDELLQMAPMREPLWFSNIDGVKNVLNIEEYKRRFARGSESMANGIKSTASRESASVNMNHINLVEIFMDTNHWASVFAYIVLTAHTMNVISTGVEGNLDGSMKMIYAEFQVPSPQIPNRDCYFVRFCKKIVDGTWGIVDVSVDHTPTTRCRKRPSGCIIQQMSNSYSKVTWIEHVEAGDTLVNNIYKAFLNSNLAFGAKRWIDILNKQCERLASVEATNSFKNDIYYPLPIEKETRKSMLKLGERMIINYCSGVSGTTTHGWKTLTESGYNVNGVQIMTMQSINDPGRPCGIVLSTSISIWLPVPPKSVFDFLRDENTRAKWDILSNGGSIQEVIHIPNGRETGNCLSILRVNSSNPAQSNMLILQESITDPSGSFIVYAPIDNLLIEKVLCGGSPDDVPLLPSGLAILPDEDVSSTGSLLTVSFQNLVDTVPTNDISPQSLAAVNNLMFCTTEKIKNALFFNFQSMLDTV